MRKILFAVLLAGAAAIQASAAPPDQQPKDAKSKPAHTGRAEGAGSKHAQPSGAERQVQNSQAGQQANSPAQAVHNRGPQAVHPNAPHGVPGQGAGQAGSGAQAVHPNVPRRVGVQETEQHRRTVEPRVHNPPSGQPANRLPNVERRRPPVVSSVPRFGAQPPLRTQRRPTPQPQWSTSWRNNQRYDWSDWRRRNRSVYHQHSYRDPFGWAYQTFSIGWRLWPNYYSSSYWINDPGMYRLPPAPPGTRWIRYYNDALLVDMWSGEVVDVIHNFFW